MASTVPVVATSRFISAQIRCGKAMAAATSMAGIMRQSSNRLRKSGSGKTAMMAAIGMMTKLYL